MTPKQRIKAILAERFPEATEVPQAGVSPFPPATPQTATVPVMITRRMEDALRNCGFSQERINKMTPSEAWEILQTEARRIAAELARLHRDGAIASKSAHDLDAIFYARLLRDFGATYTGRERVKARCDALLARHSPQKPPESPDRGMTRAGQIRALQEAESQRARIRLSTHPLQARRIAGEFSQASQDRCD
jgi:hypothetical protein